MRKMTPTQIFLILIACVYFLWLGWLLIKGLGNLSADEKRVQLLYKTDHEALLQACRLLMEQKHSNSLNMDYWQIKRENIFGINDNFREAGISEIIVNLNPAFIYIYEDDRVLIECVASFYSVCVVAYPVGVTGGGHKMLRDGLWYWDVGYEKKWKDFDKYLECLNPKYTGDSK
ncbi:MAG: hypothetical protein WCZ89_05905 [Phycisphaerae bacterium]